MRKRNIYDKKEEKICLYLKEYHSCVCEESKKCNLCFICQSRLINKVYTINSDILQLCKYLLVHNQ